MVQINKKKLAREIIIFFVLIVTLTLTVLGIVVYNSVQGNRAVNTREQAFNIDDKINGLNYRVAKYNEPHDMQLTELTNKRSELMQNHYKYHNSKINYYDSKKLTSLIMYAMLILAYPIRGLFLLVKWAIRTLKE